MINSVKNLGTRLNLAVPPSTGLREGLQWLMLARLGVLYGILMVIVFEQVLHSKRLVGEEVVLAYVLLTAGFLFNLGFSLFLDFIPAVWAVVLLNIVFDAGLTSTWIVFSKSRESLFALMYLIDILVVALTFYKRGAVIAAAVSILFFGLSSYSVPYDWVSWSIYSVIFAVLGMVGGYLSEELLRTTERLKEKSKKIEKLTELQDRILHSMPTGILSIDDRMRINFINPAGENILSLLSRDAVGKSLYEVFPALMPFFTKIDSEEISEEGHERDETRLSATGSAFHRAIFLKTKSEKVRLQQVVEVDKGSHRKVLRGDVADIDPDAGMGGLLDPKATSGKVLLFQDVTRVWNLEEKLKQHEKLAAVGQLAAGIAHEIRNPLASMSASIEMLKTSVPESALNVENHKLMEIAIREIDRLNELITEFLDFVKPENFTMSEVDLKSLVSEVLSSVKASKDEKFRIEIREKLESGIVAQANGEKIKQVLWNLVVNAIQAMTKDGVIEVGCSRLDDQTVALWVEDTGAGMTAEVLAHLYEPFFTTKAKGTGLGLATAYRIVEAHQGQIRVQSSPNVGTRFEVVLQAA